MDFNVVNPTPTPIPEVNVLLLGLLKDVQHILENNLVGMYLDGSLANGDFDEDSDIDFVVITERDIPEDVFFELKAMHERINLMDNYWAINLEGSYISRQGLRRHDPSHMRYPNIERGFGEHLKQVDHREAWDIHRYILRERGIVILGPDPKTLIDPISSDELRRAMSPVLHGWAKQILHDPQEIHHQGYQSYTVLSLCRILYTLELGDIVSKRKAANWMKENQGERWSALIDQAWVGRHHPQLPASAADINKTLDMIRYSLEKVPPVS